MTAADALLTPDDLAELFGATRKQVMEWRRQYAWPSVKIGREVRFTAEHVEQIVARHTGTPPKTVSPPSSTVVQIPGQTKRSAARARAS